MSEPLLKKRRIKLNTDVSASIVKEAILVREGILDVRLDEKRKLIFVQYDLMKVTFELIEKWLLGSRIPLSNKWVDRIKRSMAKFTEQNELDNLSATPASCCDDPREAIKNGKG